MKQIEIWLNDVTDDGRRSNTGMFEHQTTVMCVLYSGIVYVLPGRMLRMHLFLSVMFES